MTFNCLPPPFNGSLQIIIKGSPITALKNLTWRKQNQDSPLCKGKRQKKNPQPQTSGLSVGYTGVCGTPYTTGGQRVEEHPACALHFLKLLATPILESVHWHVDCVTYRDVCCWNWSMPGSSSHKNRSSSLPHFWRKLWASSSQSQHWTLLNTPHSAPTPRLCNSDFGFKGQATVVCKQIVQMPLDRI